MKFLNFVDKETILETYPGLASYLSKFTDPKIALLGKFTDPENIIVAHQRKGEHVIISVPILDDVLRYELMEELYKSNKFNETFTCSTLPYGYEKNYETFFILTGDGQVAFTQAQPEISGSGRPKFDFKIDMTYTTEETAIKLYLNGDYVCDMDLETEVFPAPAEIIKPLVEAVEDDTNYPSQITMWQNGVFAGVSPLVLVRLEDPEAPTAVENYVMHISTPSEYMGYIRRLEGETDYNIVFDLM